MSHDKTNNVRKIMEKTNRNGLLKNLSSEITKLVEGISESVASVVTTSLTIDAFLRVVPVRGVGSAFVISEDGYLVTNSHVVANAESITLLIEGQTLQARILSLDPSRDIALLKTQVGKLKPIKLGDSDKVSVGELVLAIGSPLGLPGPNVSIGVVSAKGRAIEGEGFILEDLIQTDAAINPGNSGGPLVNMDGEVIGVTTAIIPFAQGIGFAIPINTVKRFIEMISKYGRPIRAYIGVVTTPLNEQIAGYYGLPVREGLIVLRVLRDSPADEYGIREGDIITHAGSHKLKSVGELRRIIEESIELGKVRLKIFRGWREIELEVPIAIERVGY
ncbi:MAG: trypsin-like peptidase domain-containing protein [Thaumarchaeota archaeon]|jgi:S1-C subfamily serine protease|nr:trypsin-like peptidase domain-containing protein [Candidatus Geocrenenecus arthurdayi]MCL7390631.1 trypsin-like peptidase domain-containing protein [Candidatus Geocrenenecus arthurdayi]MCL7395884.1 trypsin-like peptidase domain-containing protein [Candidatus Geocrenenecus arthurdayi]MCL7403605.1 trypsin-like peptidase domain-containing protein [Candidatus Geocrenenecus arthurdayi]